MHYFARLIFFAMLPLTLWSGQLAAQEHGSADQAKALAEKGIEHIKSVGPDKAFADFTAHGGGWQQGDLYIFALTMDGTMVAHGANKALVGKKLLQMKDASGKHFVKDFTKLAQSGESGWVDYMWTHPQSKKVEPKSAYIVRIPDYQGYLGVGIYK